MFFKVISLWLQTGPKANEKERKQAMLAAQQFMKDKGYSQKTQVCSDLQTEEMLVQFR